MTSTQGASNHMDVPVEQRFLLRVGEVLHSYGTPSHRLEALLARLAQNLEIEGQFLSTPTSLIASLGSGRNEQTRLLRATAGEADLGRLVELDELTEDVEDGVCTVEEGLARLEALEDSGRRFNRFVSGFAFGLSGAGAAAFLEGQASECLAAFVLGILIFVLGGLLGRSQERVFITDATMAFLAGGGAVLWDRFVVPVDYTIVTLAALIILIPGLSFTVGMLELATRHLSSGVARLAGAATTMLLIVLGVALAWRITAAGEAQVGSWLLPQQVRWAVMAAAPLGFAILFQTRMREWWIVYLAGAVGLAGTLLGKSDHLLGPELGPFIGALFVGLVGNIYARVADRPSSVAHMPGILLIVPGTVGYKSLTFFLAADPIGGTEHLFLMAMVGAALVGGLLTASALLPPRRSL